MADKNEKNEFNVAGKFYVDSQCIGCALCASILKSATRVARLLLNSLRMRTKPPFARRLWNPALFRR